MKACQLTRTKLSKKKKKKKKNIFFAAFALEMSYLSYLCEVQYLSHFTVHIKVIRVSERKQILRTFLCKCVINFETSEQLSMVFFFLSFGFDFSLFQRRLQLFIGIDILFPKY
jgi:hypothetical protein